MVTTNVTAGWFFVASLFIAQWIEHTAHVHDNLSHKMKQLMVDDDDNDG